MAFAARHVRAAQTGLSLSCALQQRPPTSPRGRSANAHRQTRPSTRPRPACTERAGRREPRASRIAHRARSACTRYGADAFGSSCTRTRSLRPHRQNAPSRSATLRAAAPCLRQCRPFLRRHLACTKLRAAKMAECCLPRLQGCTSRGETTTARSLRNRLRERHSGEKRLDRKPRSRIPMCRLTEGFRYLRMRGDARATLT